MKNMKEIMCFSKRFRSFFRLSIHPKPFRAARLKSRRPIIGQHLTAIHRQLHILFSILKAMKSLFNFNFFYHIISLNGRRTHFPSLVMILIPGKKISV